MRPLIACALILALAACKPAAKEAAAPPPPPAPAAPPPVVVQVAGDWNAAGTEPFWALEVREKTLKLSRPGEPDIVVPNPGATVQGPKTLWPAQGMSVTFLEGSCSDGMSDKTFSHFAEVTTVDVMLKGCATRPV